MARGDFTPVIAANVAACASVDRQPSAGCVEMLLAVGGADFEGSAPDGMPPIQIGQIDGTNDQSILLSGNAGSSASTWFQGIKAIANNTVFFQFLNAGANQRDLTFSVVEVV